jgi:hypothetical protein
VIDRLAHTSKASRLADKFRSGLLENLTEFYVSHQVVGIHGYGGTATINLDRYNLNPGRINEVQLLALDDPVENPLKLLTNRVPRLRHPGKLIGVDPCPLKELNLRAAPERFVDTRGMSFSMMGFVDQSRGQRNIHHIESVAEIKSAERAPRYGTSRIRTKRKRIDTLKDHRRVNQNGSRRVTTAMLA